MTAIISSDRLQQIRDMTPEEFRAIRQRHGLSRAQMAWMLGRTAQTVQKWELRTFELSLPTYAKMLAYVIDTNPAARQMLLATSTGNE